jgi:transposase
MPNVAYVGLDISQADVSVCFLLADGGEPVPRWTVANSQPGAAGLSHSVAQLCQRHQVAELRIGLEATGLLWWHLACALSSAALLLPFRPQIYVLNPHLVETFRRNYGALPKTDRADAFLIAERIRFGRQLPSPFQVDVRYAPLQRLTRFRFHLAHNLAREKSYFLSFLFLTFSSFGQVQPFGDPFGATSSAVLTELTTEELAQQSLAELAAYLQTQGHGRFADPQALAETLQRAARDAYRLDQVLAEPLRIVLSTTMANIRALVAQLKTLDQTIAAELQAIPQTLASVPGLGPVWTAGLIAELGDVSRFADDDAIAQFAGLTWPAHESGQFQAEDTHLSQRGNRYLRYYLVEAANSVRRHCPEYADYYAAKYAETPKHPHQRALVLTARKLVRLIDALLRSQALYQAPDQCPTQPVSAPPGQRPNRQRHHRRADAVT